MMLSPRAAVPVLKPFMPGIETIPPALSTITELNLGSGLLRKIMQAQAGSEASSRAISRCSEVPTTKATVSVSVASAVAKLQMPVSIPLP